MNVEEKQVIANLIRGQRWAALASVGPEGPEASWVAYVAEPDFSGFLLHISTLSPHTRNFIACPSACLAISEPEREKDDPQKLARIMIQGQITFIERSSSEYILAAHCYQQRLPHSIPRFDFCDFILARLYPTQARFVGGFARAFKLDAAVLQSVAQRTS